MMLMISYRNFILPTIIKLRFVLDYCGELLLEGVTQNFIDQNKDDFEVSEPVNLNGNITQDSFTDITIFVIRSITLLYSLLYSLNFSNK